MGGVCACALLLASIKALVVRICVCLAYIKLPRAVVVSIKT